jgi:uncharacterized RDD family membrane protein YckC
MRFDEIELQQGAVEGDEAAPLPSRSTAATFLKRAAALLTDLSLFAALGMALSPLLPSSMSAISIASLAGFLIIVAFYYFAGARALWGRTIGGAIFDVRTVPARRAPSH